MDRKFMGETLRKLRKDKKITITEMAKAINNCDSRVVRIEAGRFELTLREALLIKKTFGIDLFKTLYTK